MKKNEGWWIDTGASTHVTYDRGVLKTYEMVTNDCKLALETTDTTQVIGKGKVKINYTFENTVTLQNVSHATKMRNNLVSSLLLNEAGFKQLIESDQFVITKNDVFVGKCYVCECMFKLNVVNENNSSFSVYMIASIYKWHGRLLSVPNFGTSIVQI